jgi:PadR family transcriptional regulator, regulatory protein PadR
LNAKIVKETQTKLAKGLLDTIILEQLQKESLHGYQLITNIRKGFGVYFGPSTIYPLLGQLEKKGYVQSAWNMTSDRPRKEYTLTQQGKSLLSITENTLMMMCQRLTQQTDMNTQVLAPLVIA